MLLAVSTEGIQLIVGGQMALKHPQSCIYSQAIKLYVLRIVTLFSSAEAEG